MQAPIVWVGEGHQYLVMLAGSKNRTTCSPIQGPTSLPNFSYHSCLHLSFNAAMSGHASPGSSVIVSTGGPPSPGHFCTRLMTLSATNLARTTSPLGSVQTAALVNFSFSPEGTFAPELPPPSASGSL